MERPVNQAIASGPEQLLSAVPPKKYLKVPSAGAELTPLTRLARFKEIRDRNLARTSLAKNPKRSNLVLQHSASKMINGSGGPSTTNGVAHTTDEPRETPSSPLKPKSALKSPKELNGVDPVVQNGSEPPQKEPAPSPKKNELSPQKAAPSVQNGVSTVEHHTLSSSPQEAVVTPAQTSDAQEEAVSDFVSIEEDQVETDAESSSEAEAENGREGSVSSSVVAVADEFSSGESTMGLDLNVSCADEFQSPEDSNLDVTVSMPGPSGSLQEPASNVEATFVPDLIKRLESGGHISSRPTLGERRKRRPQDDISSESGRKRHCDGNSSSASLSTSWQFISSSALKNIWNRQGAPSAEPKPTDDSMIVNVSTSDLPKKEKWCSIM